MILENWRFSLACLFLTVPLGYSQRVANIEPKYITQPEYLYHRNSMINSLTKLPKVCIPSRQYGL